MATAIITGEMLKPCPFCGGEAHTRQLWSASGSGSGYLYSVSCPTEGCYGHDALAWYELPRDAAETWNRRAERTYRPTHTREKWECDVCRCAIRPGFMPEFHGVGVLRYCPNCGARVTKEARDDADR